MLFIVGDFNNFDSSFWSKDGDGLPITTSTSRLLSGIRLSSSFPLMAKEDSPSIISFIMVFLYLLWFSKHQVKAHQFHLLNSKPVQLVYHGFMFGVNGIGVLLFLGSINLSNTWTVKLFEDFDESNMVVMIILLMLYVVLIVKVVGLLVGGLLSLDNSRYLPLLLEVFGIILYREWFILHPGYGLVWFSICEMTAASVAFAFKTLSSASKEMQPHPKWKDAVIMTSLIHSVGLIAHGAYLLSSSKSYPSHLSMSQVVYAGESLYGVVKFVSELS